MPLNSYPTYQIETIADHHRLMSEKAAVLCLWFEWSIPAVLAKGCIQYWHERWHLFSKIPVIPLYYLNGDLVPEIHEWIRRELLELNGNGSLYLIQSGKVTERVSNVIVEGLNQISARFNAALLKDSR